MKNRIRVAGLALFTLGLILGSISCASSRKKNVVELAHGRTVALIEITGEGGSSARSVVEVALINEIQKNGQFTLVSKQDVQAAKDQASMGPMDSVGVARASHADYALRIQVTTFTAEENEGVSMEKVYDSELAAEQGKDHGNTERLVHVKRLNGDIALDFVLTDVANGESTHSSTSAHQDATADTKDGAIHLPPRLRFMEQLAQTAISDFLTQQTPKP